MGKTNKLPEDSFAAKMIFIKRGYIEISKDKSRILHRLTINPDDQKTIKELELTERKMRVKELEGRLLDLDENIKKYTQKMKDENNPMIDYVGIIDKDRETIKLMEDEKIVLRKLVVNPDDEKAKRDLAIVKYKQDLISTNRMIEARTKEVDYYEQHATGDQMED